MLKRLLTFAKIKLLFDSTIAKASAVELFHQLFRPHHGRPKVIAGSFQEDVAGLRALNHEVIRVHKHF